MFNLGIVSRRSAFSNIKKLVSKDENTKQELEAVKNQVRAANIDMNDDGEIKELSKDDLKASAS